MSKRKRWNGEFLVEVRPDGSVLLPIFDFESARPTHYRVQKDNYNDSLHLHPMKVATEEDLQPPEPEPPKAEFVQRPYTEEELASLELECPFCGQEEGRGCISRPSGKMLIDYPRPDGPLVHSKRLAALREERQLQRSQDAQD